MPARLSAFVIWAAAAAGAVFWALRLAAVPIAAPPGTTLAASGGIVQADLSRLLGAPPLPAAVAAAASVPTAESARIRLLGVIAAGRSAAADAVGTRSRAAGIALLAIDGKPPRALRVGSSIEGGLVLQSVSRRGAAIGPPGAPASVLLELPPLPPPATGEPVRLRPDGSAIGVQPGMPGAPGLPGMPGSPPGMPGMSGLPPPGIVGTVPSLPQTGMPGQPTVGGDPATATQPPPAGVQPSPTSR